MINFKIDKHIYILLLLLYIILSIKHYNLILNNDTIICLYNL